MNRRSLLSLAPALPVVFAFAAIPVSAQQLTDPMVEICKRFTDVFRQWIAAEGQRDEHNLQLLKDDISRTIRDTPITTAAGFGAFVEFVAMDNFMGDPSDEWPDLRRWQWLKIKEWAEASALVAA
ncbi:hypothetical protein [Paracoccus sp. (in: a-proteobacteria)]|uniref:hypothetical protein n=1 Tax=Paracoccus sp. TaxID=267 RepID=UPI00289C7855|nr:hypothetical protein [Paracoccus sp. (in: a-proteobacteria)]